MRGRPDSRPFRPCVGVMLIGPDGRVWVGRRIDTPGESWQMPQGGIDEGESPREAALREMHEEIGTDRAEIVAEHPEWLAYDLPPELSRRVWDGRFRGQTQRWFALRFTGADSDIDLDRHEPEFSDWRWEDMDRLPDLAAGFKREVYTAVVAAFRHLAKPTDNAGS